MSEVNRNIFSFEALKEAGTSLLFSDTAHMWMSAGEWNLPELSSNIIMQSTDATKWVGVTLNTQAGGFYKPPHHEFVMSDGDFLQIEYIDTSEEIVNSMQVYFDYIEWKEFFHSFPFDTFKTESPAIYSHVFAAIIDVPKPTGRNYESEVVKFRGNLTEQLQKVFEVVTTGSWAREAQERFNRSTSSRTRPFLRSDDTEESLLRENNERMRFIARSGFDAFRKFQGYGK